MKTEIGIIGHVDHGKTTLTAAIMAVTEKQSKTIHEIIEEDLSIKITAPIDVPLIQLNFKDGKESRRERRSKERKINNKHKW